MRNPLLTLPPSLLRTFDAFTRGAALPTARLLACVALSTCVLGACGASPEKPAAEALEVSVVEVQPQTVVVRADFVGTIDGIENADIRARVGGYLQEVHFKEGSRVKTGDLLFTIDPVLARADLRRAQGDVGLAQAAAAKAQADVERLSPLVATNAVSRDQLDHARASKQAADAQIVAAQGALATAQASLDYTKVRSPIDGVVGVRKVSIGSLVGQGEPTLLTTVSQLDTVRVRFPISEQGYLKHASTLNRLVTGADDAQRIRLDLILADGSVYPQSGWLALIDRAVSVSTGSILLEARFPNPEGILRPGQFGRVRVATEKIEGALAVPQRAVIERQSLHEVFVLGPENKVERRAVTAGARVGRYWLIDKGLQAGEKVLVEGTQKVKPGAIVTPKLIPLGEVSPPSGDAPTSQTEAAAIPPDGPRGSGESPKPPATDGAKPSDSGSR